MIAVDTNLLIYAHRVESPWHKDTAQAITQLSEGNDPWAILWPCVHEFFSIVTHPRIFKPPTPIELALAQLEAWLESPSIILLSESPGYWPVLKKVLLEGMIVGPKVHDARIAALCQLHGVSEIWTFDRDFSRFPGLSARNPLVR